MAITLNTTLRNARGTAIITEAGANAKLSVYTAAYGALDSVAVTATQSATHPQSAAFALADVAVSVGQTAQRQQALAAQLADIAIAVAQGQNGARNQTV